MRRIFSALTGWKGYVLTVVLCLGIGVYGGWTLRDWKQGRDDAVQAEADAASARTVVRNTHRSAEITQDAGAATEARREAVRVEYRTIYERIPVYVTQDADRAVDVPVGFVRVHDAAAEGSAAALPDRPGEPVDTPSGVALSAVADTVAGNYAQCLDWREQLIGWQDWYAEQLEAWGDP